MQCLAKVKVGFTGTLTIHTGEPPTMDKFETFWSGIWEDNKKIDRQPWMDEIEARLREKAVVVNEIVIGVEDISKVIKKRKNWSSPGVDGIQNYWWKKMDSTWPPLVRCFNKMVESPAMYVEEWFVQGRKVLLPKEEDLSKAELYRPIRCLNAVYKLLTGKYMKAETNGIWDQRQLGTKSAVLGTIDHILVDRCVLEEIKEHKRNASLCYFDYKKAYDMVPHEWMDMVFEWMGFHGSVCKLLQCLRHGWKTRLEVFHNGEVQKSRVIRFLRGDSWSPVGFCLTEVPLSMMLEKTRGYTMDKEMSIHR